ncbi:MAG: 5-formyltetrahydrofolate cyclo-ligase [Thermoproteota archaeon]|nr:5-formyltetrahydrofolate cyclo-ligase [Thermoproteota archaeon]
MTAVRQKKEKRQEMLSIRNKLNREEVRKKSKTIQEFVINSKEFQHAEVVGAYFAFGSEVTTELIIGRARILGKRIALPRVESDKITFYEFTLTKSLIKSRFGIMEPPPYLHISNIDILLVPGIAFDKNGNRLGYGKGFYDRLLTSNRAIFSVGLAYLFQIVDNLPHDMYDQRLDAIASEDGVHYI